MDYIEITITVPPPRTEAAADALRAATGGDVWIEAPFVQPDLESDAIVNREAPVAIHAYASAGCSADAVLSAAAAALASAGIDVPVAHRPVREEDWAESWKQYFDVERYGARLVVVPSWRKHIARDNDIVLTLDPGMAFGTGQHETTRMCLEALERHVRPGMRVLDVGCGSGILAIAAAKLGATDVCALDIDPNCVRVTRENAERNGIAGIVRAAAGSLGDDWPFASPPAPFDLVVANIISRVIVELAPYLAEAARPNATLIASGVIGERLDETVDALRAVGFRIESVREMGDWRCVVAVREMSA